MSTIPACLLAIAMLVHYRAPNLENAMNHQIAQSICYAAKAYALNPRILAAYTLNENGNYNVGLLKPAAVGYDAGIFQVNTAIHSNMPMIRYALYPAAEAALASQIIKQNFAEFGYNWRGVAAYWSPEDAKDGGGQAIQYFDRWHRHFLLVSAYFNKARQIINAQEIKHVG
jgi:hypothetical protein